MVPWTSFIAFCIDGYLLCVLHFAQMNQTDAFLVATFIMRLTIVTTLALCACANLSFIKSNLIEFLWILTAFSLHIGRLLFFPHCVTIEPDLNAAIKTHCYGFRNCVIPLCKNIIDWNRLVMYFIDNWLLDSFNEIHSNHFYSRIFELVSKVFLISKSSLKSLRRMPYLIRSNSMQILAR